MSPVTARPLIAVVAALAALLCAAAAHSAPLRSADVEPVRIRSASNTVADARLTAAGTLTLLRSAHWGGQVTASTGETVTVLLSDSYPEDPATAQRWADFLAGLPHGDELSRLTAFIAPLREVQRICGAQALACYSPQQELMVAPGESPGRNVTPESVVAHEYGHHLARNRLNTPWAAVDYGTKRWASYVDVCARTQRGELYPRSRSVSQYVVDPAEGFAESYRLLYERRAGVPESAWDVVDRAFYPDDRALALIEADIARPWTGTSTRSYRPRTTARVKTRTVKVSTPLDGRMTTTVRAPRGTRVQLEVLAGSKRVASVRTTAGGSRRVTTTVCGTRSYGLRVRALSGTGTARLDVAKP